MFPLKPDQASQTIIIDMYALLYEFVDVFSPLEVLPPPLSIENSINMIPNVSLPNVPFYHLALSEVEEIEHQFQHLLNASHI